VSGLPAAYVPITGIRRGVASRGLLETLCLLIFHVALRRNATLIFRSRKSVYLVVRRARGPFGQERILKTGFAFSVPSCGDWRMWRIHSADADQPTQRSETRDPWSSIESIIRGTIEACSSYLARVSLRFRSQALLMLTWRLCCLSMFLTRTKVPSFVTSSLVTVIGTRQSSVWLGSGSVASFVSHGCCFVSMIVALLSGVFSSIRPISDCSFAETFAFSGNASGASRMSTWRALLSEERQGTSPTTSANSVTPIDHKSHGWKQSFFMIRLSIDDSAYSRSIDYSSGRGDAIEGVRDLIGARTPDFNCVDNFHRATEFTIIPVTFKWMTLTPTWMKIDIRRYGEAGIVREKCQEACDQMKFPLNIITTLWTMWYANSSLHRPWTLQAL